MYFPIDTYDVRHGRDADERLGRFFWRKTRKLRVRFQSGGDIEINDFVTNYDVLREQLLRHARMLSSDTRLTERESGKLIKRSMMRDELFGDERWWESFPTLMFRLICLLPVFAIELFIGLNLLYVGFHRNDPEFRNQYAVYVPVIMLCVSAIASRTVYYYLFSSKHGPRYQRESAERLGRSDFD
jgi:hypothetical protein